METTTKNLKKMAKEYVELYENNQPKILDAFFYENTGNYLISVTRKESLKFLKEIKKVKKLKGIKQLETPENQIIAVKEYLIEDFGEEIYFKILKAYKEKVKSFYPFKPRAISAGFVYIYLKLNLMKLPQNDFNSIKGRITQTNIANIFSIVEPTIRRVYREIMKQEKIGCLNDGRKYNSF